MPEIKLPAMSPTMEEGTLAKWLVSEGDSIKAGDVLAEIETDKATMELEADDPGTMGKIMVAAGSEGVKVGTVIAIIIGEDDDAASSPLPEREGSGVGSQWLRVRVWQPPAARERRAFPPPTPPVPGGEKKQHHHLHR